MGEVSGCRGWLGYWKGFSFIGLLVFYFCSGVVFIFEDMRVRGEGLADLRY